MPFFDFGAISPTTLATGGYPSPRLDRWGGKNEPMAVRQTHQSASLRKGASAGWPSWAPGAVEAMRKAPSISRAAKTVGVNRTTINRLRQRDEAFALAINDAREEALDTLEEVVLMRATTGQPMRKVVTKRLADGTEIVTVTEESHISDTLAMFYLKRWRPEYRDTYRVERSDSVGGVSQVEDERKLDRAVERFRDEVLRLTRSSAAEHLPVRPEQHRESVAEPVDQNVKEPTVRAVPSRVALRAERT